MASSTWESQNRRKRPSTAGERGRSAPIQERESATLVIATRSGLVQAGLLSVLEQVPELDYLASANDASSAARSLNSHRPDVFVIEDEIAAELQAIYKEAHRPRVLLYSNRLHLGAQAPHVEKCACGIIRDRSPVRHIRAALRIIGACRSPTLGDGYCASCPLRSSLRRPRLPLSEREYLVFERIGHGDTNQEIARRLDRSVKTIETHRESIKRKLGLESGSALTEAAFAWKRGEFVAAAAVRAPARRTSKSRSAS